MGACDFKTLAAGKDLKDAFKNAVNAALYEHGHDSYNGTISTTSLCGIREGMPRYGTKAFYDAVNRLHAQGGFQKWDCWAIEVKGKALKAYRQGHGLERRRIRVFCFFGLAGS